MALNHLAARVVPAAAPAPNPDQLQLTHEQIALVTTKANEGNDFYIGLREQYRQRGYLSPKQVACIDRDRARAEPTHIHRPPATQVQTARLEEIFGYAKSRGIKQPQMRLGDFKFKTASTFSSNAGAIYVTVNDLYLGKIMDGRWLPVRAGEHHTDAIAAVLANPDLAAIAYGERTGNCAICGRLLTAEESINRTIGPVCAENYGLL